MNIESFVWNICDDVLRGLFKQHEYGDVILPFLVLRRLDCVQEGTKNEVIKLYEEFSASFDEPSEIIHTKLKIKFSNHSKYDLKKLISEPSKISENLYEYLRSFSPNVQDIIQNFGLQKHIDKLEENDSLFIFIQKFSEVNLHPSIIDNHEMGSIFEELLRKFSEISNETSGEHYTPRDIVNLLVSLVFTTEVNELSKPNKIVSLYDPCCGTGGMLTVGKDWIKNNIDQNVEVNMFGQELNPQTYSICKSDFLITNEQPENIKLGSTLSKDGFSKDDRKFDYMICNPPYGVSWKKDEKFVKNESSEEDGRFNAGVPRIKDGQLLFLQHMISKMEPNGSKIGVVFNASPMHVGDAGNGESEIRRWLIENDLLETIVQMPDNMFFNTGITTYLWIITNKKVFNRKGKVQLIDASKNFKVLRKKLGDKRKEISNDALNIVLKAYIGFEENELSKIFKNDHFKYTKVQIEQPELNNSGEQILRNGKVKPDKQLRDYERIPFKIPIEKYFENEVKPNLHDAWMDRTKDKVGYEINFVKEFFKYSPLRDALLINEDLKTIDNEIKEILKELE